MYEEATAAAPLKLRSRVREAVTHPAHWLQLFRYGVVGVMGYGINVAIFAGCVHGLGIDFRIASSISFLVAVAHNFFWNRHWTFDAGDGHAGFQAARFFAVSLLAYGVSFLVLILLVSVAHMAKVPAQALAVIAGVPLSFLGQKLWSFRA